MKHNKLKASETAHNIYYDTVPLGSISGGFLGKKREERYVLELFSIKKELNKRRNAAL